MAFIIILLRAVANLLAGNHELSLNNWKLCFNPIQAPMITRLQKRPVDLLVIKTKSCCITKSCISISLLLKLSLFQQLASVF